MKTKNLIMLSGIVLISSLLIGFSITNILNKPQELGTIYIMPSELDSAISLKENTGANVVVVGLLGETAENIIPKGNVEDLI